MKILLIEDRPERQKQFLKKTGIDIVSYRFIDNKTENEYKSLKNELLVNISILEEYDIIISHRSAFGIDNAKIIDAIKNYCETNKKYLILFSGGISTSYYTKTPYEYLSLNSKDFYSDNLKLFLDNIQKNNDINLLLLTFGEQWELNLILNIFEKLNTVNYDDIDDYDALNDKINITSIDRFIDLTRFKDKDEISLKDIQDIKHLISKYINKELGIHYA